MKPDLKPSAKKVQQAVLELGFEFKVIEFDETTRTSADAAAAIGCTIGQIAKTLVFKTITSHQPVLVIASGANRVNEKKLFEIIGERTIKADAMFVREATGFAIGGIPPVAHKSPLLTYIDEDLFQYPEIWAAAGTPNAVFRLTPEGLEKLTGAEVIKIT